MSNVMTTPTTTDIAHHLESYVVKNHVVSEIHNHTQSISVDRLKFWRVIMCMPKTMGYNHT